LKGGDNLKILDKKLETLLENACWYYYNKSKTEPFRINTNEYIPGDGFYEIQQETNYALRFLESNGYIEQLFISAKCQSYKITQKGLEYFDPPQNPTQNITTINQGNKSNAIIGDRNTLNMNINSDIFIDIQASEFDNEHKILLTKLNYLLKSVKLQKNHPLQIKSKNLFMRLLLV
jgi:hypothetical protein